ncbi:MAG: hypothetical protein IKC57_05925 [Alistipes sp.]|nr:hypothetical protein [Alistipes sp.]
MRQREKKRIAPPRLRTRHSGEGDAPTLQAKLNGRAIERKRHSNNIVWIAIVEE